MTETAARPEGCKAAPEDDLMVCERCGLSWLAGLDGPPCEPITLERLRKRMCDHSVRSELSMKAVDGLRRKGAPADSTKARREASEDAALLRLVDRCIGDPILKGHLLAKGKANDTGK